MVKEDFIEVEPEGTIMEPKQDFSRKRSDKYLQVKDVEFHKSF